MFFILFWDLEEQILLMAFSRRQESANVRNFFFLRHNGLKTWWSGRIVDGAKSEKYEAVFSGDELHILFFL